MPVVNTFIGNDKDRPSRRTSPSSRRCGRTSYAADHGVKIAIENCPMIFSADEWPGGNNLMYAPATWRDVFAALDGDTLGLNLDPSHLVWQMIDYERAVREFGSRIYHVHAKDMEIDRDGLYDRGVMSAGMGWQVPCPARPRRDPLGPLHQRCTAPGTTTPSSSNTRTAGSRAATRRSRPASTSPATPSPHTSPRRVQCKRRLN